MKHGNAWRSRRKPRRYIYDRDCKAKARFTDEPGARAGALVAIENPRSPRDQQDQVSRLWVYRCPHCFGWHMTSNRQSDDRYLVESERKAA